MDANIINNAAYDEVSLRDKDYEPDRSEFGKHTNRNIQNANLKEQERNRILYDYGVALRYLNIPKEMGGDVVQMIAEQKLYEINFRCVSSLSIGGFNKQITHTSIQRSINTSTEKREKRKKKLKGGDSDYDY